METADETDQVPGLSPLHCKNTISPEPTDFAGMPLSSEMQ